MSWTLTLWTNKKAQLTQRNARQQCMYDGPLRTNVKSVKTSILVLKVIQGHCFWCQSKPVYGFLLIVTSALSRTVSEIWRLLGWNPYPRGRYSRSRSSKVIDLGLNGKLVGDFLLVINCNLGPISHRFRDMASYWFKIAKFSYPPLI